MPYSPALYGKVRDMIDERRLTAISEADARARRFAADEPRYRELRRVLSSTAGAVFKAVGMPAAERTAFVDSLRDENLAAQEQIKELLRSHGLPEDWLEPRFVCKKCSDTGVVDGRTCDCVAQLLRKTAYEDAQRSMPLRSFSDFRLDYYPAEVDHGIGRSPRAWMKEVYDLCVRYADDFDEEQSLSLLFIGKTGLGKTFLSLAIAGEIVKKGYSVYYTPASALVNALNGEYFGKTRPDIKTFELARDCDLLIIDDLGAEFDSKFGATALCELINGRIESPKPAPMIISTNLSVNEIERRYSARFASRLIGEFDHVEFFGTDIRQLKAEESS